ncbi:PKD domain-containing protein [archaeon]
MRKGVNPVVAVVLLIAIAVIAAVAIYFWAAGQDITSPKTATFIDISVSPVNVTDGTFIVTNMGGEYLELASLDSVSGVSCDFAALTEIAPGDSAVCTTPSTPYCEMTFFGEGTIAADVLMGGTDCVVSGVTNAPVVSFISEDTGGTTPNGTTINFTATATDADGDLDTVMVYTNITGATAATAMAPAGGDDFTVSIDANVPGTIAYYGWANDSAGFSSTNGTYEFEVEDPNALKANATGPYAGVLTESPSLVREWDVGATEFNADYDEYCVRFQPLADADHDVVRLGAEFNTSTTNATLKLRSGDVGMPPAAILQSCSVPSGQENIEWRYCDITPQTVTQNIGYWFCICADSFVGSATDSRNGTCAALPAWTAGLEAPNFRSYEASDGSDGYEAVIEFLGSGIDGTPPYSYAWGFDDPYCDPQTDCDTETGVWPTHPYSKTGVYTANLTVTDAALDSELDTAQVTISAVVSPWSAVFDSGRDEIGYAAIDGSLYVVGYQFDGFANDVFIMKVNRTNGDELWNVTHDCEGFHDQGLDFTTRSAGGFAVAGTCGTAGDQEAYALTLDSSGALVKNVTWDATGGQDYFLAVLEDGTDLVFAGVNDTTVYRGLIVKYDSDLVEDWNVTFNQSGDSSRLEDIIEVSDGYVAVGVAHAASDLFVWKVDKATGATTWSKDYDHLGANRDDYGLGIIELDDGGFGVTGYTTNAGADNDVWIMRLDSGGNEVWNVTYDGGTEHDFGYGLVEVTDGIVVGGTEHNGADYDFWVREVAMADGATTWTQTHDNGGNDDYGYSLEELAPAGFVMTGNSNAAGNFNIWVLRLNQTGYIA